MGAAAQSTFLLCANEPLLPWNHLEQAAPRKGRIVDSHPWVTPTHPPPEHTGTHSDTVTPLPSSPLPTRAGDVTPTGTLEEQQLHPALPEAAAYVQLGLVRPQPVVTAQALLGRTRLAGGRQMVDTRDPSWAGVDSLSRVMSLFMVLAFQPGLVMACRDRNTAALHACPAGAATAPSRHRARPAHPGHGLDLNGLGAGSQVIFPEDDNVGARAARGKRESGASAQPAARVGAAQGRHEEPKGSHHGDSGGGSPGLLRPPSGTRRCPARSEPLARPVAPLWAGQASLLT